MPFSARRNERATSHEVLKLELGSFSVIVDFLNQRGRQVSIIGIRAVPAIVGRE
jgi:hypothetical protein